MKYINNIFLIFIMIFFLNSCEGFNIKKKSSSGEEFLINKKDPLILPPDFSELPKPNENIKKNNANEEDNGYRFWKIFDNDDKKSNSENKEDSSEYGITRVFWKKFNNNNVY